MSTESRTEQLLNAYINGDDISNFVPLSRNEQILKDMILGNEQTSSPQSRIESLYKKLDEKIKEGSGGDNPLQYIINNQGGDRKPSCYYLFTFYKGTSLDDIVKELDTSKVTDMSYMFNECKYLTTIPQLDTSSCINMENIFYKCLRIKTIPQLNTSKVTNMSHMFDNCEYLESIPQLDTSSCIKMGSMFNRCISLNSIPQLDTSSCTYMSSMFDECSQLKIVPQLNTSKVTNMGRMFYGCQRLESIPQLDTSSCTYMSFMFYRCTKLKSIQQLDTSKATDMRYMFGDCNAITTISQLDMYNVNDAGYIFQNCTKLTYLKLLNIKINLQIGAGTSWGHLIGKDCLIQIISELIKPSSGTKTLTMGTANKAKIADTYIKLLADDGTGKYPFEVCESTDEGAMTIEAYCNSKNWTLA